MDRSTLLRADVRGADAFDLPLDEEFVVDRAGFVLVEAVFVRVVEPLQREVFATPRIGTIQERAMMSGLSRRHIQSIGRLTRQT